MTIVLVVDDERTIRDIVAEILGDAGFQIVCASDGYEALALARQQSPRAIVSDVRMPHISGVDLVQHLQADTTLQHIPVILYSAQHFPSAHTIPGVFAFLHKPFDADVLEQLVRHAVDLAHDPTSPHVRHDIGR